MDGAGAAPIGLAASSELAPGTHLRLLHAYRLPTPGMSVASSLNLGCDAAGSSGSDGSGGPNPLTPQPMAAVAAFGRTGDDRSMGLMLVESTLHRHWGVHSVFIKKGTPASPVFSEERHSAETPDAELGAGWGSDGPAVLETLTTATLKAKGASLTKGARAAPKQRARPLLSRLLCAAGLPRD